MSEIDILNDPKIFNDLLRVGFSEFGIPIGISKLIENLTIYILSYMAFDIRLVKPFN